MKHATHEQMSNPLDVFGMMGMQVPPFDLAEKTCRAWMAGAQAGQLRSNSHQSRRRTGAGRRRMVPAGAV